MSECEPTEWRQLLPASLLPLLGGLQLLVLRLEDVTQLTVHVLVAAAHDKVEQSHDQFILAEHLQETLDVAAVSVDLHEATSRVQHQQLVDEIHEDGELVEDMPQQLRGVHLKTLLPDDADARLLVYQCRNEPLHRRANVTLDGLPDMGRDHAHRLAALTLGLLQNLSKHRTLCDMADIHWETSIYLSIYPKF